MRIDVYKGMGMDMRTNVHIGMGMDMRTDVRWAWCHAPSESSRRGGRKEYRHADVRALDVPSAMADERPPIGCSHAHGLLAAITS